MRKSLLASFIIIALVIGAQAQTRAPATRTLRGGVETRPGLAPADVHKLQSVGSVQLSPDGTHVAYSITQMRSSRTTTAAKRRTCTRAWTPTLFLHGENDNDVPIAEAEPYFR